MFKRKVFVIMLAAAVSFETAVYAGPVANVSVKPADAVEVSAREDIFRIDGSAQEFVLLDIGEEGFFVSSKEYMGLRVYDSDNTGKYDIDDSNNMAYWLNNDFLEKGNTYGDNSYSLPEQIKKHLVERDWLCEAGHVSTDYSEDYQVRAKVALMSLTEWKKYFNKLGYKDDTSSNYYFLRSVDGANDPGTGSGIMLISVQTGTSVTGKAFNPYGVRPVFYLDKNFFTEVKLDMTALGDNIAKTMRENYSKNELSRVYSSKELEKIYKSLPPQAKKVKISGIPQVGKILEASYNYVSPEGTAEGKSDYRWLRSKTAGGPFSTIYGENTLKYKIRPEDEGYYIVFEVVPKTFSQIGYAIRSSVTKTKVEEAKSPYAENVYIDGEALVGERLIARYNYADENDDIEKGTVIQWQNSEDGKDYQDIDGAVGLNYIIGPECEGKYIRFKINVKNEEDGGESGFSESAPIGPVKSIPMAEVPEIQSDGSVVRIVTETGENDVICWETAGSDGEYVLAQLGKKEYNLTGKEKSIRVRIIPFSGEGIKGVAVLSNTVTENPQTAAAGYVVTEMNLGSAAKIFVGAENYDYAYSMILRFECDGVNIESIESDYYNTFMSKKDNVVTCILTKTSFNSMNIPEKIMTAVTSGSGKIKLIDTEGIYRTQTDGEYISSKPLVWLAAE